jgi:hypothetical protein
MKGNVQNFLSSHRETMFETALLTHMRSFRELHVFHQVRRIDLFGIKRAYLPREKVPFMKYITLKLTPFSQGNKALDAAASYTRFS